jgi:undecaprenyl-diphosphatase
MTPVPAAADFAGWRRILWLDLLLLALVRRWERRAATRLMRALTRLGDTSSWLLFATVLAAGGGEGPRRALLLVAGAGLALAVSQALKRTCCRPRPSTVLRARTGFHALAEDPDAFSFPSGHTAVAFAVALALAGQGQALAALTLVLAAGIGVSRIYLGAHYPLDVAAGALLGGACGWAARSLLAGLL